MKRIHTNRKQVMIQEELTKKIIKTFYKVYNELGYGFLEKVCGNAMDFELTDMSVKVEQQRNIRVYYNGLAVGDYFADLFLEELVIVKLKAAECVRKEHEAQLLNYLRARDIEVRLLLNFGKKPEFRRKIFTNDRKGRAWPANRAESHFIPLQYNI